MEKSKFIGFVNRYFLGGNTDSAKLVVDEKKLSTKFISADQNVIGEVTLNNFDTPTMSLDFTTANATTRKGFIVAFKGTNKSRRRVINT